MGQAVDIVKNIMENEDNYEEWGLIFPKYTREWKEINLLVGENGSGKSRILGMIKKNVPEKCTVFHLDFANYVYSAFDANETLSNTQRNSLVGKFVSGSEVEKSTFSNFLPQLNSQILDIFNILPRMWNNDLEYTRSRARDILNDINPSVMEILRREIKIEEDDIYLCKKDREITVENEWELLSPGERSILLVVFAVLFIRLEKKPCVLLIDELETHLHPSAQVKLYELIKKGLEKSDADHCTCIASHSIFLLPHFGIQQLVYMNNGEMVKINGGLYQQIYDDLTGESGRKKESLTDFLFSMSAWQYAEYLAECFLAPTTVDSPNSHDIQALQFVEVLKSLYGQKEIINVLDFGSGSGRIGKCIELMLINNNDVPKLISKLKYNIYDKYNVSFDLKENTAWIGRTYLSEGDITSSGTKFDLVLLYNVLHEIGVDEWIKELKFLLNLLSEDGLLLFGEREILSIGEKPYGKSGYLVLGKEELTKLFPDSEIQEIFLPEKQKKTSTICFAIKKPNTGRKFPNKDNLKNALRSLKINTKKKIRNRDNNGLGERGHSRKYAFYCQQYINAEEALEALERTSKLVKNSKNEFRIPPDNANLALTKIPATSPPSTEKETQKTRLAQAD